MVRRWEECRISVTESDHQERRKKKKIVDLEIGSKGATSRVLFRKIINERCLGMISPWRGRSTARLILMKSFLCALKGDVLSPPGPREHSFLLQNIDAILFEVRGQRIV
jgi:hypothetical protein